LGLTGTQERIPKILRYVKLNHPCHDPFLDRVNLCGRGSKQLQVQPADHPQEIEKTEEEGRKAACAFGEIGDNCDFTSARKRPAELHTRPPAQFFRLVTGCPSGSLTSLGSSYLIAATTLCARFLLAREAVCGAKCFRMKGTTASTACIISGKTS
jgi:hypothetical protein